MIPTEPSWPDLILVLLIVLYTIYCAATYRRTREQMASGALTRGRVYCELILVQWTAVLSLAGIWWLGARSVSALGMAADLSAGFSSAWGIGAWSASVLTSIYLLFRIWAVGRSSEARQQVREQFGEVDFILPRTPAQLRGFSAVGLTAGICEEILYRGFLLWWFQAAVGLGLTAAAVASTLVFGLGHAYQGWQGMIRAGMMGALLMAVRLAAGSLWPAMALHAAVDILIGWLAYRVRPDGDGADPSTPSGSLRSLEPTRAGA
ncbi:MAG: type II CAAX endopeptidase family protein [Acidobacteriota bacterium]